MEQMECRFVGWCFSFDSKDFCWVYLGGWIVSIYIGIILSQYKDSLKPPQLTQRIGYSLIELRAKINRVQSNRCLYIYTSICQMQRFDILIQRWQALALTSWYKLVVWLNICVNIVWNISVISVRSVQISGNQVSIQRNLNKKSWMMKPTFQNYVFSCVFFFVRISSPEKMCMLLSFPFEGR